MCGARGCAAREPAEEGWEPSLQKGCPIPAAPAGLSCSVAISSGQKETYGRPAEAASGAVMQFFEDEELAQLESDSFLHAWINAVSFFLHRDELLNARARACERQGMPNECGAKEEKGAPTCKATYTENEGQFLAYRVIKIQAL